MYFSRITLSPSINYQQLAREFCRDAYREHQVLWGLFDIDPNAKRDFLYRQVVDQGRMKYYLLSKRKPSDESDVWQIDGPKKYDPALSSGQRLSFMLRANPVIAVTTPDGKKQRNDIVMHEKMRSGYKRIPKDERPLLQQLVQDSCVRWLKDRAEAKGFSFDLDEVIADGYRRHKILPSKREDSICYSTVDFQGRLTVTDVDLFKSALFSGIGKSKAFGCGLMLIRRI